MKQLKFGFTKKYKMEFGGSLLVGKRKGRRPLSTKHPIHLILKASGKNIFWPGDRRTEEIFRTTAKEFGVKINDFALNWTHVHLIIQIPTRDAYIRFIRAVSCRLVKFLSIKLKKNLTKCFYLRPFTRILSWGRDVLGAKNYVLGNDLQAWGLKKKGPQSATQSSI